MSPPPQDPGSKPTKPNPQRKPKSSEDTTKPHLAKSTVKTFRPPPATDGQPTQSATLLIHTYPSLYARLTQFLAHFDKPPNQMYFELLFTEMRDVDVKQMRWKFGEGNVMGEMFDQMVNGMNQMENVRLPTELQGKM